VLQCIIFPKGPSILWTRSPGCGVLSACRRALRWSAKSHRRKRASCPHAVRACGRKIASCTDARLTCFMHVHGYCSVQVISERSLSPPEAGPGYRSLHRVRAAFPGSNGHTWRPRRASYAGVLGGVPYPGNVARTHREQAFARRRMAPTPCAARGYGGNPRKNPGYLGCGVEA